MRTVPLLVAVLAAAVAGGCTHLQLARSTVRQSNTITDIHYRQVLNNLAEFQANPDVLPHFAVVGTGGTLVTDVGSATLGLNWNSATRFSQALGLGAEREIEDGWTLAPIVDPDKLRAIRCVFQLTTHGETFDPDAQRLLSHYLGDDYLSWIERGWYGSGRAKDVPKNACYMTHCGKHYVWVGPEGLEGLSRLTLCVLNIATLDVRPQPAQKEVRKYHYNHDGQLDSIETYREPHADGEVPARSRENYYNPLQSQIQMGYGR